MSTPTASKNSGKRRFLLERDGVLGPLMLAPSVIYIVALVGIPFVLAIAYSLSDITVGNPSLHFVGLKNFRNILEDRVFLRSLRNSVVMTLITMVLVVVIANALAQVLVKDFRGKWVVRFLILLPWTTPVSLATIAWLWLLDTLFSPIDWVLRHFGLIDGSLNWLANPTLAPISVIAVQTWRIVPLAAVIIMAGLVAVPQDIQDAARVDGAGFWRTLFEVTVPLTAPVTAVAVLFGAVLVFSDMSVVYVLTRGGPIDATQILPTWAFFRGIQGGDLGQGAAIALFALPILVLMAASILRSVRKMEIV
jgi:multiple sugar transport system permease protein